MLLSTTWLILFVYKFLQAGGDCFSNMVIISKGLANIDAAISSNSDGYKACIKNSNAYGS